MPMVQNKYIECFCLNKILGRPCLVCVDRYLHRKEFYRQHFSPETCNIQHASTSKKTLYIMKKDFKSST